MTYEDMIDKLKRGEQFSFSRWGDGEWNAVLGRTGENCDGHKYFADMGERLKAILESKPGYYTGMQPLAIRLNQEDKEFQRLYQMNEWVDAEIIYKKVLRGHLDELFEALSEYKPTIVGANHVTANLNLNGKLPSYHNVEVEPKNSWSGYVINRARIYSRIKEGADVILYCAGMMSNVLIDDFKDAGVTQIDIGSAFDPLCGVYSRGAYRKLHEEGKL